MELRTIGNRYFLFMVIAQLTLWTLWIFDYGHLTWYEAHAPLLLNITFFFGFVLYASWKLRKVTGRPKE